MMSFRLCGAAIFAALLVSSPLRAATAYVSNEGSGTVSIIDTATDKVTSTGSFAKKAPRHRHRP